jgi:RNA polymerase sigma-70 factor, ECF subfamily
LPLTRATSASSARRGLIERAMSSGRVVAATLWTLPSGRVTCMLSMGNFSLGLGGVRRQAPLPLLPRSPAAIVEREFFVTPSPTNSQVFDEAALVERARAGDQQAFGELVRQYERKVYRLAMNITRHEEDAEDVLQEAFLKAYEHLDRFKGDSKFYTWLVRIAVNEALMKLRQRRGDRTVPLDEPLNTGEETVTREIAVWDDNPEQQYSKEEIQKILSDAVDGLKADFRTVFTLRDIEELSTEETAEILGLSIPAVKSRLLRARLALREKLTRQFKRKGEDVFAHL